MVLELRGTPQFGLGGPAARGPGIPSYVLAIPLAFVNQWTSDGLYVLVALMWLMPAPRIEAGLER